MEQVNKSWGYYQVIKHVTGSADSFDSYKIKNLYINPGQSLSDQRHFKRAETWIVMEGGLEMKLGIDSNTVPLMEQQYLTEPEGEDQYSYYRPLGEGAMCHVNLGQWHQATNNGDSVCYVIEIQRGIACEEDDIERRNVEE